MGEQDQDIVVSGHLQALGLTLVSEWDALSFLCRHAACLCTAGQIARFIGYDKDETGVALRSLEALGLIERSRVSKGVRIYRSSESAEPIRRSRVTELMRLAQNRSGRLVLLKHLKRVHAERRQKRGDRGLRLA